MTQRRSWGSQRLVGPRIERLPEVTDGVLVPVPNACEAVYAIDARGRQWVRKRLRHMSPDVLMAEALGWLLAKELGGPIPDAALVGEGEDLSWLSSRIDAAHWSPHQVHFVGNFAEFGRVLALDAIVFTPDRHAGNILLEPHPDEMTLRAWAIDVGNALIGKPRDYKQLGADEPPPTSQLAPGLPFALLEEGAREAAVQATTVPDWLLRQFVEAFLKRARNRP